MNAVERRTWNWFLTFSRHRRYTDEDSEDTKTTYTTNWFQRLNANLNYGVSFKTSVGGRKQLSSTAIVVGEYQVRISSEIVIVINSFIGCSHC